jgi:hypothetical protein
MTNTPRTSGVFSLGALGGDGTATAPWTPADITTTTSPGVTVVGWFDGENVNGGTSGNSSATSWVNQISGQNDLSFNGSPTVGTDNVRTISGSYLTETGTASFQQTADWRVFMAATIKGGSTSHPSAFYYPLVSHVSGTIDTGGYIFWRGGTTFAAYPNYNNNVAWGNFDNYTPGYGKTYQNNPGVYDFTASTSSPWKVSFDGGRDIKSASATYTTQIGSGRPMVFGWGYANARRLDAEYKQIVVIQGTLSSGDEEKLYGYLAHKAGSASDLPSSNQYQSAAPTKAAAGATRPMRRWGGITGRSLVETTGGGGTVAVNIAAASTGLPTTGVLSLAELLQVNYGVPAVAPDGLTSATAATSAEQILLDYPSSGDGIYWIDDGGTPKQVYCDMTNDGGGWMLYTSFATNSTYDATNYPAWNVNRLGAADMRSGSPQYGWSDDSQNGRDGTTTWGSIGTQTQYVDATDGAVYLFWDHATTGLKGVTMTTWNGPSTITKLRVGWGKGASTFSSTYLANSLLVNNVNSTNSPQSSVTFNHEVVSFNPSGATPLLGAYESGNSSLQGINGISAVWMR